MTQDYSADRKRCVEELMADTTKSMLGMGFERAGVLDRLRGYQMKSSIAKVGLKARSFPNAKYGADGEPRTLQGVVVKVKENGGRAIRVIYSRPNERTMKTYIENFLTQDEDRELPESIRAEMSSQLDAFETERV
jgi:hypothetical protein